MSTFGTYVFRQAFSALVLILFSLIAVVWIGLALKQLKLVTSKGQDIFTFVSITTLAIPKLMAIVAPIALLIAVIHILNRLNSDSELIVVTASGGPIGTVLRPLLVLGLVVAMLSAFVNHIGMPWSLRKLQAIVIEARTDLLSQLLLPGKFSAPMPSIVVHIAKRDLDGTLHGLLIDDRRNSRSRISYLAERARVIEAGTSSYLAMENGHIVRGPPGNEQQRILRFDNYAVDLERFEQHRAQHIWKPQERYTDGLLDYTAQDKKANFKPGHFVAEFHERFSSVLYPFLFVFVAVAFVGQAQSTRQNRNQKITMAFVVAIGLRGGGLALNNATVINPGLAPLMYVLPLAGIGLALLQIHRNARPRPGLSMSDRVEIAAGDLAGAVRDRFSRLRPNSSSTSVQPGE